MVCDAMCIIWSDPYAKRYGRSGQKQNGCDVYGKKAGRVVVAQAKNMEYLSERDALKEIEMAENYPTTLQEMHFAISGQRDARFAAFIENESAKRLEQGRFSLQVWFFDDLVQRMAGFPNLEHKYLSAFIRSPQADAHADIQELKNRLAALEEQLLRRDDTPVSEQVSDARGRALPADDGCWRLLITIKQAQQVEGGNTKADQRFIVDPKLVTPDASSQRPLQEFSEVPLPSGEPVSPNKLEEVLIELVDRGDRAMINQFPSGEKPGLLVVLSLQHQLIKTMKWISYVKKLKQGLSSPPIAVACLCRQSDSIDSVSNQWLAAGNISDTHSRKITEVMSEAGKQLKDLDWLLIDDQANESSSCPRKSFEDLDKVSTLRDMNLFFGRHHALMLRCPKVSSRYSERIKKILYKGIPLFFLEFVEPELTSVDSIAGILDWECADFVPKYCKRHRVPESQEDYRLVDSYLFWEDHRYKPMKTIPPMVTESLIPPLLP